MNKPVAIFLVLFSMMVGCNPPKIEPRINHKTDAYTGSKRVVLSFVSTFPCVTGSRDYRQVYLGAMAWKKDNKSPVVYSIDIIYRGKDWVFIEPGKTFEAIYYNEPHSFISFDGSRDGRHVEESGLVTETAVWEVTRTDLEEISLSPTVQFRITGSNGRIERCLGPNERGAILRFLFETKDFK